jgi:hypothetical protein
MPEGLCVIGRRIPEERKTIFVIVDIHHVRQTPIPHIGHALCGLTFRFCFAQSWKQHSGKDSDDRDHDQKLDESESAIGVIRFHLLFLIFAELTSIVQWSLPLWWI